ncbi:MAG: AmmeMemoRadiSam system protein B [Caldilineales bacterium]|nr:AmmeMemoRadiSam system protein B [Caldilineales bacterium]
MSQHTSPQPTSNIRKPAVAGSFYPAHAERLRRMVEGYLTAAETPAMTGRRVTAVIAPHAGYVYSGPTAGYSFASLPDLTGRTIFLMGPAHYVPVDGVALTSHAAFETPLGRVQIAGGVNEELRSASPVFHVNDIAHAPEHSLEVELPFLKVLAADGWECVPLLFGQVNPERVAATLLASLTAHPDAIFAISSDLSHFRKYAEARRLDIDLLESIVRGDIPGVSRGEACGRLPILIVMHIARNLGWQAQVLDYRNSGDTGGDRQRVVGYGAVIFTSAAEGLA